MNDQTALASFLRARRDLIKPNEVGLRQDGPRRVSGLRRSEVAGLAGISVEYYLRLETGRDTQPSDQVLQGLACALQLDDDATEYMYSLVRPIKPARRSTRLDPAIEALTRTWSNPAYVQAPNMTVVAANIGATSLSRFFSPGVNTMRDIFLDPELRHEIRNWESISAVHVKWLRFTASVVEPDNMELWRLIDEMRARSAAFRNLWGQHEPARKTSGEVFLNHPKVGSVDLVYRTLVIPESRHTIVTYLAAPGSESEEKLTAITMGSRRLRPTG